MIFNFFLTFIDRIIHPILVFIFYPFLIERRKLEKTSFNNNEPYQADMAFEVSSEGELEQVLPIIEEEIIKKKIVELIFCSKSLIEKVQTLKKVYREQIKVYPLPLTRSFRLSKILKAKKIIFCRYDFFPELLLLKKRLRIKFILVSAKKLTDRSMFSKFWLNQVYKMFDEIYYSTKSDFELDQFKNKKGYGDLRILQILKRQKNSQEVLRQFNGFEKLNDFVSNKANKKIIHFSQIWESDLFLFDNQDFVKYLNKNFICLFSPHKLNQENVQNLYSKLHQYFDIKKFSVKNDHELNHFNHLFLTDKGILCELYTLSQFSYVGGGFGRSVHSLLEPFLAHNIVFCGEKTWRSTEYEYIINTDKEKIKKVNSPQEFLDKLLKYENKIIKNIDNEIEKNCLALLSKLTKDS